ncbi:MAG: hypothetical protein IJW58_00045 [Clostridia bacterium]|nr:hypothetical protein [Clostridia bacterium]
MKQLRKICMILATALTMVFLAGCYVVQAQPMKNVKGTYQLTKYTYTRAYDHGKPKPTAIDYIVDRGFEEYLVVTGTGAGYFVHKDNETEAYCLNVNLAYQNSEEDSSKIDRFKYQIPLDNSWSEDFGVTKGGLNYYLPSVNWGQWLGHSKEVDIDWKKVSDATDLSYVETKFPNLTKYTNEEWAMNVVFELSSTKNITTQEWVQEEDNPYEYYYIAINSIEKQATTYYALKENLIQQKETKSITLVDGWNTIQIDGVEWTKNDGSYTYKRTWTEGDNEYEVELWQAQREWTENSIAQMIQNRIPKILYEITNYENMSSDKAVVETPYQYYFIAFDPNLGNAMVYYALKSDMQRQFESRPVTLVDGWNKIKIGEEEWTNVQDTYTYQRTWTEGEGETAITYRARLEILQRDWDVDGIFEIIEQRMPATQE